MSLLDFFKRRKDPEGKPQGSGGVRGFFSRLFNRRKKEKPEKPAPLPEPAVMEEPDISIDDDLFDQIEDAYNPPPQERPATDLPPVTTVDNESLMDKYSGMLDTMVEKGYIQPFDSDEDAAEFLRVLSSDAWEEAHTYWYSVEALQQIQDAIARGATAGSLQDEYNKQVEKKSKNYLKTWEAWQRVEG